LKKLISISGVGKSSRAIEIGCGTGNYIAALEERTGCACWGIDPSEQMLSRAKGRYRKINFQSGEAKQLNFPDGFYDLVFSVDVIHYLDNRPMFFGEANRTLKQGGRICTVTDSAWIIRHRQPLAVYFPETVEVELDRYPGIAELGDEMIQTGFEDVTESTVEFRYRISDIQAYREKAFSALRLISNDAFARGIKGMERDLTTGPIQCVSRYLLLWGTKK